MTLTINSTVIDNDVEGNNGRGTVYLLTIRKGAEVLAWCTYGLMDELDGAFYRQKWIDFQLAALKDFDVVTPIKEVVKKEKPVLTDPFIISYINFVIDQNQNVVQDYKKGKSASLNFLVGCVMKKNSRHDPEVIKNTFRKILDLD